MISIKMMRLLGALSLLLAGASASKGNDYGRQYFNRVAFFPSCLQLAVDCDTDTETLAEIVSVTEDGNTLIYTDSATGAVGFVDIADPANPQPLGFFQTDAEPTSVDVAGRFALVAVDDSESFVDPSGRLLVIDIATRSLVRVIELGGQPDSVAVSPDGKYVAIAIENQRDEDLGDGSPPQLPAGYIVAIDLYEDPATWVPYNIEISGLPELRFPEDPEPEFVSINHDNVLAVTAQENNAIILIDIRTKLIIMAFSAGADTLPLVDLTEDDVIDQSETQANRLREPDGVAWIGNRYWATADEGDLDGGSRGFTIYDAFNEGRIVYTSNNLLEHIVASIGHYPEARSENKGNEPENIVFGIFGGDDLLFVNSERSSVVLVFDVSNPTAPEFVQVLPAATGPEGGLVIPSRNLYVVASEVDDRGLSRGGITIYQRGFSSPEYPTIVSGPRANGTPIPFAALSGLAAETRTSGGYSDYGRRSKGKGKGSSYTVPASSILYSIEDSFFRKSRIFTIDVSYSPAYLVNELRIVDTYNLLKNAPLAYDAGLINMDDDTVNLDLEGVALIPGDTGSGWWVAVEGAGTVGDASRPVEFLNYLIAVDEYGRIIDVVTLPDEVNAIQVRFGFEGVAVAGDGKVVVCFQRAWGNEANPRLGLYDPESKTWKFFFYPLEEVESPNGGWVGLSDIAPLGGYEFLVVERDNQGGPDGRIKRIYKIDLTGVAPGSTVSKELVRDLIPDILAKGGQILEKIEGLAVTGDGEVWIVNDNDGVDDNSGEIQLLNVMTYY
jgi:hypothetical protein